MTQHEIEEVVVWLPVLIISVFAVIAIATILCALLFLFRGLTNNPDPFAARAAVTADGEHNGSGGGKKTA